MKKLFLLLILSLISSVASAFQVSQASRPLAEIVLPAKSHQTVRYAAEELQRWIAEITGATLPLVEKQDPSKQQIVLALKPAQFAEDVKKLTGNDGYAVRKKGKTLYLIASCPKGILNAVYKMLFKNTDIIWARPNEKDGTFFSKDPDLKLKETNYIDIPVYVVRGFMMVPVTDASAIWQARNGSNWDELRINVPLKLKLSSVLEVGGGHNLVQTYITEKKYYKDHPDFFPLRKGKRMRPSEDRTYTQLCFTNREMIKEFIRLLDERIKQNPNYETYRVMIEDNYNVCECPECSKPIKLADGKTITVKHPAFQSTRFFLFLNELARFMKKNYPGKRILTFAYFFTEIPPLCPVESNIDISFCPIYKDSKRTMVDPLNKRTYEKFRAWVKVTPNVTMREYYGLTPAYPRPIDVIAFADLAYANKFGVKRTYSELYSDYNKDKINGVAIWDANVMYFWVLVQASWNPYLDVKEMRREFLDRVFRDGADDMEEYYRVMEERWFKTHPNSVYHDEAVANWGMNVVMADLEKKCRSILERAGRKIQEPKAKKLYQAIRNNFESNIKYIKDMKLQAVKTASVPVFDPEFKTGGWEKAIMENRFYDSSRLKSLSHKTEIRALYDDQNLYIGVKCIHPTPAKMKYRAYQKGNTFPHGEGFEVFLSGVWNGKEHYAQMVFDPSNNRYSGMSAVPGWKSQVKITKTGWSGMLTVPWKGLGFNPAEENSLKGAFIRQYRVAPRVGNVPSIAGQLFLARRHRPATFCTIELKEEN